MISSTKVYKILKGFRVETPLDLDFLKDRILRLSQLISEFPQIVELDINPLKILPKGGMAVDVRAVIV